MKRFEVIKRALLAPLTAREKCVLIGLLLHSDGQYANSHPGNVGLARYASYADPDRIPKVRAKLELLGLISSCERRRGVPRNSSVSPEKLASITDAVEAEMRAKRSGR